MRLLPLPRGGARRRGAAGVSGWRAYLHSRPLIHTTWVEGSPPRMAEEHQARSYLPLQPALRPQAAAARPTSGTLGTTSPLSPGPGTQGVVRGARSDQHPSVHPPHPRACPHPHPQQRTQGRPVESSLEGFQGGPAQRLTRGHLPPCRRTHLPIRADGSRRPICARGQVTRWRSSIGSEHPGTPSTPAASVPHTSGAACPGFAVLNVEPHGLGE